MKLAAFLICAGTATSALCAVSTGQTLQSQLAFQSRTLKVQFDTSNPAIAELSIDSLGKGEFRKSPLIASHSGDGKYAVTRSGEWIQYASKAKPQKIVWALRCGPDSMIFKSTYVKGERTPDLIFLFDPEINHATLLGRTTPEGNVKLPAILHMPGMGTLRVVGDSDGEQTLGYEARRSGRPFVKVEFPAADASHPVRQYTLSSALIYPAIPAIENDSRYDGFKRDYLSIFQQNASLRVLANNAASDPCPFTLYEYADVALYTPRLFPDLTALDLIRDTLDRYLEGFKGYGMPGFRMFDAKDDSQSQPYTYSDVYPSLLISAEDYVGGSNDEQWLRRNYPLINGWAHELMKENKDGSPLTEYPASGNSGSWSLHPGTRPANWWDTIGFGHQDAYSNALAYRALKGMGELATRAGHGDEAARFANRAEAIRLAYASAFLDRQAGVLAGWKSSDGKLHNYYFPFVNGIAVTYGLLDRTTAYQVMTNIEQEMIVVGYNRFDLGLPGNLVPIKRADYTDHNPRFGGPSKEDGSDKFQVYENGGATACFAYFTMAALYRLNRDEQADKILFPMLDSFSRNAFMGRQDNGMTNDWKDWTGRAHGYEGFLADSYYALMAVLEKHRVVQ